jgi:hypothetical protein
MSSPISVARITGVEPAAALAMREKLLAAIVAAAKASVPREKVLLVIAALMNKFDSGFEN